MIIFFVKPVKKKKKGKPLNRPINREEKFSWYSKEGLSRTGKKKKYIA